MCCSGFSVRLCCYNRNVRSCKIEVLKMFSINLEIFVHRLKCLCVFFRSLTNKDCQGQTSEQLPDSFWRDSNYKVMKLNNLSECFNWLWKLSLLIQRRTRRICTKSSTMKNKNEFAWCSGPHVFGDRKFLSSKHGSNMVKVQVDRLWDDKRCVARNLTKNKTCLMGFRNLL